MTIRLHWNIADNDARLYLLLRMLQADLAPLALQLAAWGVQVVPGVGGSGVEDLRWLDPPPPQVGTAHALLLDHPHCF